MTCHTVQDPEPAYVVETLTHPAELYVDDGDVHFPPVWRPVEPCLEGDTVVGLADDWAVPVWWAYLRLGHTTRIRPLPVRNDGGPPGAVVQGGHQSRRLSPTC